MFVVFPQPSPTVDTYLCCGLASFNVNFLIEALSSLVTHFLVILKIAADKLQAIYPSSFQHMIIEFQMIFGGKRFETTLMAALVFCFSIT